MKYSKHVTYIIILIAASGSCWEFLPAAADFRFKEIAPDIEPAQLEFVYGTCSERDVVYFGVHLTSEQIENKFFITGWLNITATPRCIIFTGTAVDPDVDMYKGTAYSFKICIAQVTFIHTQKRWKYFFYEWFVPNDVASGVDWNIYFLGPNKVDWE